MVLRLLYTLVTLSFIHLATAAPQARAAGWQQGKTGSEPAQSTPEKTAEYKATFLHKLSDFAGTKPFNAAKLKNDPVKGETYVITGDSVAVFNTSGMEVFRIESDSSIGLISDIVVTSDQKLVILASKNNQIQLRLCNYRGEQLGVIPLEGLPPELKDFSPNRIYARDKLLYLVNMNDMRLVVTDEQGTFVRTIDLGAAIGMTEQERSESGLGGFALDRDGGFVMTVSSFGKLYTLSSDGAKSRIFGRRGSRPGNFSVPVGVAVDRDGNYLVVDKLRCVVMVFDRNFTFLLEFAKRGLGPADLIAPDNIIVDGDNRAYISNLRKRGVVVYQLSPS